jgi:hypothetical protein
MGGLSCLKSETIRYERVLFAVPRNMRIGEGTVKETHAGARGPADHKIRIGPVPGVRDPQTHSEHFSGYIHEIVVHGLTSASASPIFKAALCIGTFR